MGRWMKRLGEEVHLLICQMLLSKATLNSVTVFSVHASIHLGIEPMTLVHMDREMDGYD